MEEEKFMYDLPSMDEVTRIVRDVPPANFTFKINSFSQLSEIISKTEVGKYESCDFDIGGYKWRLSLYPDGDKKRGGSGYISLYLVLSETNVVPLGSEIKAFFKLFVYDQIRDKYLTIQCTPSPPYLSGLIFINFVLKIYDISPRDHTNVNMTERRFHATKTEWGFSKLLPLNTFNDAANGYLIDDCCVFGAEVFVTSCTGKGESFSIIKEPQIGSFSWKIDEFSTKKDYMYSKTFTVGGHKWDLLLHPKGDSRAEGKSLSFFLDLDDYHNLRPGQKMYVEYKLRIRNQLGGNHHEQTGKNWFCASNKSWGFSNFILLSNLNDKSMEYIVTDTVIVEGQITLMSLVKGFS